VRRLLERTICQSARLTPVVLTALLGVVDDGVVLLVLDSSRCGCWEVLTLGLRFHGGRVLPVAWAVLPYPWPRRQFTPTTLALLERVLAVWPADRPVHLVADRGFPSFALFRRLDAWRQHRPLGYTIRLRAGDWVRLNGEHTTKIATLLPRVGPGRWQTWSAAYRRQTQACTPATLVIGRGVTVLPPHQTGPADQRRRQARAARQAQRRRSKGYGVPASTDQTWVLLSTEPTWRAAMTRYSGRFSTEGTYRDWKSWDWDGVVGQAPTAALVDAITGVAALGAIIQTLIGAAAGCTADAAAQARQRQWTTTDRLSVFSRGRLVLHDRAHAWLPWLTQVLPELADRLRGLPAPAPALPTPLPARHPPQPPAQRQVA
jgi:hypothetical protein